MGNDGGSIPSRRELVRSPTRKPTHSQLRDNAHQSATYHWTYCPLSKHPLSSPVVSDSRGFLYNKDSIIEWLLKGLEAFGDGEEVLAGRVAGLKDVVEVKFERDDKEGNGGTGELSVRKERWICPVTKKELGPGCKSVYLVPCGHAFSENAVKEIDQGVCLQCAEKYEGRDIIVINSTSDEDWKKLDERAAKLKEEGLTHSLKSAGGKKRKKGDKEKDKEATNGKKNEKNTGNIGNASTAALTKRVLGEEKEKSKKRKLAMSDTVKSLYSRDSKNRVGGGDFLSSTVKR